MDSPATGAVQARASRAPDPWDDDRDQRAGTAQRVRSDGARDDAASATSRDRANRPTYNLPAGSRSRSAARWRFGSPSGSTATAPSLFRCGSPSSTRSPRPAERRASRHRDLASRTPACPPGHRAPRAPIPGRYLGACLISSDITRESVSTSERATVLNGYAAACRRGLPRRFRRGARADGLRGASRHAVERRYGVCGGSAAAVESAGRGIIWRRADGERLASRTRSTPTWRHHREKPRIEGGEPKTTTEKKSGGANLRGLPGHGSRRRHRRIAPAEEASPGWTTAPSRSGRRAPEPTGAVSMERVAKPTVTVRSLAGVLNPEYILGGRLRVRPVGQAKPCAIWAPSWRDGAELANGVIRLVNASMINALSWFRSGAATIRGSRCRLRRWRRYACRVPWRELGVKMVVVPPRSGCSRPGRCC
jgi:hypothetical protein